MPEPTAEERAWGRYYAHKRWSQEPDRTKATQPLRDGLERRFIREVDPDGTLPPHELAKRVASAKKAYYTRLSILSAQARRKKASA
jgi:hypothetical protein